MADHSERWIVCMRLIAMHRVHPRQIERPCARCGQTCGIYPSGQAALARDPGLKIVCDECQAKAEGGAVAALAPGALLEPFESVEKDDGASS